MKFHAKPSVILLSCAHICRAGYEQIPLAYGRDASQLDGDHDVPIAKDHAISSVHEDSWTLTSTRLVPNSFQHRPYVANGYFGQNLPAEGVGYWVDRNDSDYDRPAVNGWPLDQPRATFGTISGFWGLIPKVTRPILDENVRRGWESVISGIPDWTGLVVTSQSQHYQPGVNPESVQHYQQSFNFRNGMVCTNVTWTPLGQQTAYQLDYTVLAHRSRPTLGIVRLDITSNRTGRISVTDILDGAGATRSVFHRKGFKEDEPRIWTGVRPEGIGNVTAYQSSMVNITVSGDSDNWVPLSRRDGTNFSWVSQNASTIAQSWMLDLTEGQTVTVLKYVGIVSSEDYPDALNTATETAREAALISWDVLIKEHIDAWEAAWDGTDIVVPSNENLTVLARSSLFHLLASLRPDKENLGGHSIMVGGLASDSYAGLIFWDAETWMYPALLVLRPEYADNINKYRLRLLGQAVSNAQLYNYSGALYPWTSARYGNCTGTGLCQHYQYHLNIDIALAHWQYYLQTKSKAWLAKSGWPVIREVADMFAAFVRKNTSRHGQYETIRMGEPDEYVWDVNNGAFTNAGIKKLLGDWALSAARELSIQPPSNWSTIADNIVIPYDPQTNLIYEYDNMPGDIEIKQASVALINYPLDYRISTEQAENDIDFYGSVTSPNGPAMTWSVFAISEAQLQYSGCSAYTYLLRSYEPYLRTPFYQFSEQILDDPRLNGGISPAFPFLTGHGGFLQIFTHGLTGFRFNSDAFVLDPVLPPHFSNGILIRGMRWQDAIFDVNIQPAITTIYRRTSGRSPRDDRYGPVPVRIIGPHTEQMDYHLNINENITVPTRRPDLNEPLLRGNQAQCARISSDTPHVAGHLPEGAIDGLNATVWQPLTASQPGEIVIDLGRPTPIHNFTIIWGNIPPERFAVSVAVWPNKNSQNGIIFEDLFQTSHVAISSPYQGPKDAKIVKKRYANATTHVLTKYKDIRFFKLMVLGTQANNKELGATVAEIGIF